MTMHTIPNKRTIANVDFMISTIEIVRLRLSLYVFCVALQMDLISADEESKKP